MFTSAYIRPDIIQGCVNTRMMELFVFAILFTAAGAQQSQLKGPENTLSVVGSTVTLKCLSPSRNCSGIDWQKYVRGASPVTVFKGPRTILNVVGLDRDRYSVNNSLGCDLVIKNVQLTDAGRFICSTIISTSQVTKTAHLIILTSQSKCATNASEYNTAEGDKVRMTCELTYNDTNRASVVWNGVSNTPAALQHGTNISRSFIVDASAPEVPSFTCVISFAFETTDNGVAIVGLATNSVPNANCSTSAIKVMYSVRNVTLLPPLFNISHYAPGDVVTCTPKGRPLPTCKWQEKKNGSTWTDAQGQNGCRFIMPSVSSNKYRCVAMNVVKGQSYNATSHEIPFNNTGSGTDSSSALTLNTIFFGLPLWIWVASGGGAVILLLIIILVICCCCRACPCYKCCHSEKKSDDEIGLRDVQSPLGSPVYSTVNTMENVPPKAQNRRDRPVPPAPTSPSKRPPAPPPMVKEQKDNRKAGNKNHKA